MSKKSFIGDDGKEYEVVEKVPFYKKKWFIVVAVILLLASCSSLLGGEDEKKKEETKTEALVSETETEKKKEVTETEIETEEVTETETEEITETEFVFNPEDYRSDITYDDLARHPEDNFFQSVTYTGRVLQVMNADTGETQMRLAINDNIDQTVLVELSEDALVKLGRVLENDWLSIYGVYLGTMEYTTVMGDVRTIPAIIAQHYVVE